MWDKYMKNETMKITSSSPGIQKTIYHNDSYLLLFGNKKFKKGNEFSNVIMNNCFNFAPPSIKCHPLISAAP